ncbi:hypothetical protein A3Q56_06383 [Intoshia linei]|uniref:Uncharacterized protein n=1 Tax=Intoshia linei TaxID=1819745 RepID=A0A177AXH0_9BILA|nr:hypothetical protein A3Q56_06383 [Intoshia linei]
MVLNCFECIRNREKKNDGLTNPFRSIFSSISNRLKIFNNCEKIKLTVKLEMENEPLNCSIDSIADNVNVNYRNVFNTCIHEINEKSLNTSIFQHKTIERGKSRDLCNESVHNRLHKNTIKLLEVINLNGLKEVESEKSISNKNFMFFKKSKPKRFSYPKVLINNIPCFYSEIQSYHNRSKFNNPPKMTVYPTRRHSLPINIKKIII